MDPIDAKDELFDRILSIEPEQFEQLSKILVEEIEKPREIELTPFGSDGGIDIRGAYGQYFFNGKFGVQVKQYESSTIGRPALQKFIGALTQHNYQFGSYITTSSFSNNAIEIAEPHNIVLVDGDSLIDTMLMNDLGTRYNGFDYSIDSDFWEIFKRTEEDDIIPSDEIPQADSLEHLEVVLLGLDDGYEFKPSIREYMNIHSDRDDWNARQADYYAMAGYVLGFIHKDQIGEYNGKEMRKWGLTREGQEYVELIREGNIKQKKVYLQNQIRDAEIVARIISIVKEKGKIDQSELAEIIEENSQLGDTTSKRRSLTVKRWLQELPEIRVSENTYEYISVNLNDY